MRKEAKIKDSIKGFHWWLGALLLLLSACVTDYEGLGAGTGFVGRGWYHHEWRDYDKAPEKRGPDRRFHGG